MTPTFCKLYILPCQRVTTASIPSAVVYAGSASAGIEVSVSVPVICRWTASDPTASNPMVQCQLIELLPKASYWTYSHQTSTVRTGRDHVQTVRT
ncbi:uncharacterized protein ARMOST_12573 [Armillaria ostoyae]|uniref:Uncharacterized protein n=1 Tax=Armillaria ostoyae TaxID=47428 RepID=A0A284RKD5_ARMOS|nr:uncharacterized protein ARMOST_12573 [Armillaria ostoyae]